MLQNTQSFIRKKNTESVKQSKIITQRPKVFENPDIVDIKSFTTEHRKTSHKLLKTINQTESFTKCNSSLYSDAKQVKRFEWKKKCKNKQVLIAFNSNKKESEIFLNKSNIKLAKQAHAFKVYASS